MEKDKIDFVLLVAKAFHENGLPTHRLENSLDNLCAKIGIEADFFSSQGSIFASIKENGVFNARLVKINSSDLNLEKIDLIESIVNDVSKFKITALAGIERVKVIQSSEPLYSDWIKTLFFAISTGSAACIFGGKIPEILCAFTIGLIIGSLFSLLKFLPRLSKIIVLLAAIFAVIISSLFSAYFVDFKQDIATICGLIILIPGFSFTISITEIVNNHFIAGISRFTGAFITFLMIAIGIVVGNEIMKYLPEFNDKIRLDFFPFWFKYIALILVPMGFLVLFKAKKSDFLWISLACWCSFFSYEIISNYLNPSFAVFLASFILGLVSNIFAIIMKRNESIMLVPGMILLVPGSLGFFSISHMIESNVIAGIETALLMLSTSMALVFGLIFSNILINVEKIKK